MPATAVLKQHNMFVCVCCGPVIWILWLMSLQASSRSFRQHVAVCAWVCVCCVSGHLAAHMPAMRACSSGIGNNPYLSLCVLTPPLSLFFCLTPSIHLFPSILLLCATLFCGSRFICHLSPLFAPLSIQRASRVTFYLWHIMHVLHRWCQRSDRSATKCVMWLEGGGEGGQTGGVDHPLSLLRLQMAGGTTERCVYTSRGGLELRLEHFWTWIVQVLSANLLI